MPRQIIDTESSRPRYVRRVVLTWVVLLIVAAALIVLAYEAYGRYSRSAQAAATPAGSARPALSSARPPGK